MKFKLLLKPLLLMGLFLFAEISEATTDKYRIMWRDDPATTMVIAWNQASGFNPVVHYGTSDAGTNASAYSNTKTPDRTESIGSTTSKFARLTGLTPNTAYYFVIKDSQGTSQRFWFKTTPNINTERLSFIAGGDSRSNPDVRINANKLVAKLRPHAVLFGGDFTYNGTISQWADWLDDWQYTIGADGRMIPIVATRGNHEPSNDNLLNYFDLPNDDIYYALTFGGNLIRTYTLNTEISILGNQTSWLENDLVTSGDIIWKTAQYHKGMRPHVDWKEEGDYQYDNWASLFEEHKVQLVIECDAHTVKTTWPIVPSFDSGSDEGFIRDDANGTVYVGEGCWGAPLRNSNDNKSWTRASGRFNQFKWIFVDEQKIEVRTIKIENVDAVGQVSDNNIFTPPDNLRIWDMGNGNGDVVTIQGEDPGGTTTTSCGNDINITYGNGEITIQATTNGTYFFKIHDLDNGWSEVLSCSSNCGQSQSINNLSPGPYKIKVFVPDNSGWEEICNTDIDLTNGGCTDNDNDGLCQADDCNDFDSNFPKSQGTPCNDNNPNTSGDVILADGCTCQGEIVGACDSPEQITLLANNARQSSNHPAIQSATADKAVDGNTNGAWNQISLTNWGSSEWWQVDLGQSYDIDQVKLWNITTGNQGQMTNVYAFVSDSPFTSDDFETTKNSSNVDDYPISGQLGRPSTVNANSTGRYIRVQKQGQGFITLDEVQVFGCPANPSCTVGASCNDGNSNTQNDQYNSNCQCVGTTIPSGNPCESIQINTGIGSVTISNISPTLRLQIIGQGTNWQHKYICNSDCQSSKTAYYPSGSYTLKATNSDPGCYAQEDIIILSNKLEQLNDNQRLLIFPNPIKNKTPTLLLDSPEDEQLNIQIYNINSQLVHSQSASTISGANEITLDLENARLASGVYFVRVISEKYTYGATRFVKP